MSSNLTVSPSMVNVGIILAAKGATVLINAFGGLITPIAGANQLG